MTYIVPVYNTEPWLTRCLDSLVGQGLPDEAYEVLVVDDGSTDGSRQLVEQFAKHHPQVRLIIQENLGVSSARNRALDLAEGRYIQFVDSDDYLESSTMATVLHRAVGEELDMLLFNFNKVDEDGLVLEHFTPVDHPRSASAMTGVSFLETHRMMPYVCWYLVRRDYLNARNARFDTSLIVCEDGALIADLLLNAQRVAYQDVTPYHYVMRGGSAMHNSDAAHLRRRILSQVDAAASIEKTCLRYQASVNNEPPLSVRGLRNVYLYFSMTRALTSGCVDEVMSHMCDSGLYPFPCVGPEANYHGFKWKLIHALMMRPALWRALSNLYCKIKK
ncbi:MAG: glycosyltransferase [Muribaculaceae bacterium]|nr:glycosyltransferase [Muribaculaceae bacterium]